MQIFDSQVIEKHEKSQHEKSQYTYQSTSLLMDTLNGLEKTGWDLFLHLGYNGKFGMKLYTIGVGLMSKRQL